MLKAIETTMRGEYWNTKSLAFTNDLTFENTNSTGFKSGLYGGRERMSVDHFSNCGELSNCPSQQWNEY